MQMEPSSFANFNSQLPLLVGFFSCLEYTWNLNDINLRHHFLAFVKQGTEFYKYAMTLSEAGKGGEDVLRDVLNRAFEYPFHWSLVHLPGLGLEEDEEENILTELKHVLEALLGDANNNEDDIPLD